MLCVGRASSLVGTAIPKDLEARWMLTSAGAISTMPSWPLGELRSCESLC